MRQTRGVTAEASRLGRGHPRSPSMTNQLDRGGPRGRGLRPEFADLAHTRPMTPAEHQPWCTHHHHWCCYRGPRDSTGRHVEITDHNRFLGVKITDRVYPAEPMTADDARELIAGIEACTGPRRRDLAGSRSDENHRPRRDRISRETPART